MPLHGYRGRKQKSYTNEAGMPIDQKTRQIVFYECDVETVKRVHLKTGENFSREGANQVFERGFRKRQARTVLYCLTDRMRFKKQHTIGHTPFRKQLTYREIKHFFVFPSNPNVFMLCVVDEVTGKKLYEMYRCRPEDVNTICDLTFKASTDPQNILRDITPLRQLSLSSGNFGTEPSGMDYENSRQSSMEQMTNNRDVVNSAPDYNIRIPGGDLIDRELQNGHGSDSPIPFDNDGSNIRQRSPSPPRLKNTNSIYPTDMESKIKGVYSCYELVEPKSTRHNTIDRVDSDVDSFDYTTRLKYPPVMNGMSSSGRSLTRTEVNLSNPRGYDPYELSPNKYLTVQALPNRYSPVNQDKNDTRIIIERDPSMNPSVRKARSATNLNWGDEVTYISYNPVQGTNVSDSGPMYMYITRYESSRDLTSLGPNYSINTRSSRSYTGNQQQYTNWYCE
ncbi:unnamed protein product [Echinostoma caproni]|uniref:IRS-type PTB domain-containing protein n=1 Tax=Echinostoma caproni TaxID=27848 RepID=A0A183A6P6_9TREM|nr:unnamed protein product [Echinostoma caproni]